jgi:hypothetical protein
LNAPRGGSRGLTGANVHIVVAFLAALGIVTVLWDAFESVILPRRVTRPYRLARFYFRTVWRTAAPIARSIRSVKLREAYLAYFGPLSLLLLFVFWAVVLVFMFALLHWSAGSVRMASGQIATFRTDLYLSGSTFFTLGMGDVTPGTTLGRVLSVAEAGLGFGFLAIIISYLPTLYGAFSQREVNISLLDSRAGSPPTAAELLRRHGRERSTHGLAPYLREWETWSAQLMESHLTYPVLCYFRSQHDNQSWLSAFTAILDVSALLIAYGDGETKWQAQLTFAISRHAVADLSQVLGQKPAPFAVDRLPAADLPKIRGLLLDSAGRQDAEACAWKLRELRRMYEPYVNTLSRFLLMPIPTWGTEPGAGTPPGSVWARITADSAGASCTVSAEIESGHL